MGYCMKKDTLTELFKMARLLNCRVFAVVSIDKFGRLRIGKIDLVPSETDDGNWQKYIG